MSLTVAALWRYPVKSLAGEPIHTAELTYDGIPGDRVVNVRGPEGVRTSRRHHLLLGLHATLGHDSEAMINGLRWRSPRALELVRDAAGDDAWLEAGTGLDRFDVLPLLVATDGAVGAFGRDIRRLRPNILISGVEGMAEVDWPGARLTIGAAVIHIDSLRRRCPMTTVDPDTLERDRNVLLDINKRFGGKLALNADVVRPGQIRVGDPVILSHLSDPDSPSVSGLADDRPHQHRQAQRDVASPATSQGVADTAHSVADAGVRLAASTDAASIPGAATRN